MAGLIIFPVCFAFGVDPGSGPGLVFVTLPNVFSQMWLGQLWGALFFLFMSFAALSTVIAVFENIIRMFMDYKGWDRRKAVYISLVAIVILSLPCALGFNVLSFVSIPGIGEPSKGIEDFIVSSNMLPLGSARVSALLHEKVRLGMEELHRRGRHRRGNEVPELDAWMGHLWRPRALRDRVRYGLGTAHRWLAGHLAR